MADAPILVAGAGIAGLTTALAFAGQGRFVRIFERAQRLDEAGAGIQLSPNATRILSRLGLEAPLRAASARPEAVVLVEAATLREVARVRLGAWGEGRWGAPYLTCHRADLQRVLLDRVAASPLVKLETGRPVTGVRLRAGGVSVALGTAEVAEGRLLVGADGVRSAVRTRIAPASAEVPLGLTAWRRTLTPPEVSDHPALLRPEHVAAVLHPRAHLVAYPLSGGAFNLVAIGRTEGEAGSEADRLSLLRAFADAAAPVRALLEGAGWTPWPILAASPTAWTSGAEAALIGDAAHAMAPFAAQGAAMAIEDAATLAQAVGVEPTAEALKRWEAQRRARIARVERRGRLNRLAWHAGGIVAAARDLVLRLSSPEKLAADLDWLYGA